MDAKTYCLDCIHKDVCGRYPQQGCDKFETCLMAFVEPLTDEEKRIFLAAMGREEMLCKKVDIEMKCQPNEYSLVRVCRKIIRKVKGALWNE